jgi:hypothetical protein
VSLYHIWSNPGASATVLPWLPGIQVAAGIRLGFGITRTVTTHAGNLLKVRTETKDLGPGW